MTVYSGIWTSSQQLQAKAAGNWPVPGGALQVSRSLRFNSADSTSLNRTPASASNQKTWTWSGWVKKGSTGSNVIVLEASDATNYTTIYFDNSDYLTFYWDFSGSKYIKSSARYRDPSAWYHIVCAVDTTQSLNVDRVKLYVNGVQVTDLSTSSYPNQNVDTMVNAAAYHAIGARYYSPGNYFDGYMANINFIDGQAIGPEYFGQFDSTTGVWQPISYTGTYGTNGYYLQFADNSGTTSTTLGKDTSGNSNNWTPNNFSVTAGAGNDSLVDTPTPYGTDTGAGGEVRGNYCTLNPVAVNASTPLSSYTKNGNLQITAPGVATYYSGWASMVPADKVYVEFKFDSASDYLCFGLQDIGSVIPNNGYIGQSSSNSISIGDLGFSDWVIYNNGSLTRTSITLTSAATLMLAYDPSTRKIWFGVNGTWYNSGNPGSGTNEVATLSTSLTYIPAFTVRGNASGYVNFGQRAYTYSAPSGFKALCTTNLTAPTITQPEDHFGILLYSGNNGTQSISGLNFQPDFVWIKGLSGNTNRNHALYDVLRGATKRIIANTTAAGTTDAAGLTSFDSSGFSLGSSTTTNGAPTPFVAWNWKGGGSGVSNTDGSTTSTVSVNADAGISIMKWTYGGATGPYTVGHGLGQTPYFIITRGTTITSNWGVYHSSLGGTAGINLNSTSDATTNAGWWGDTAPTSSVMTLGTFFDDSADYLAYCFAQVDGFSSFGNYTGNGSNDGPFLYTGFRPAYLLIKRYDSGSGENWRTVDGTRRTYNPQGQEELYVNSSALVNPSNSNFADLLSNGFKLRTSLSGSNASGGTYIYMAFAENPFKYALAR